MSAQREMLEGEAYWGRIRNIKRRLYILEAALIAVLGGALVLLSNEFKTNPFYLPFDKLLWFVLIMVLVVEIEGFVFRIMQIRIAKSDSTKHLMTINSIRKAVVIVIVAALVAAVFAIPSITEGIEGSLAVRGETTPQGAQVFLPSDPLGLSRVVTVAVHSNVVAEVYIVSKFNFDLYKNDWAALKGSALNNITIVSPELRIPMPNITYANLYLLVDPTSSILGNLTVVSFSLEMQLSSTLTSFVPLIAVVFLVANSVWIAYLFPLGRKYASGSIYK
jgi:hypothetical protein